MRRESHARFCERLAVKLRRPTHPLYCTRNLKGNFRIGMRTEKSRLRRSLMSLQDLLRRIRHLSVREQVNTLNAALRGVQPELGRAHHVGHVPPDQTAATDLATKAVPSLSELQALAVL